jgi:hypothetical protein
MDGKPVCERNGGVDMRRATLLLCLFDFGAWLWIALSLFNTGSDAATRGLDLGALGAVSILFGLTGLPARQFPARAAPGAGTRARLSGRFPDPVPGRRGGLRLTARTGRAA